MSSSIAALPPPTHDIPHKPEYHDDIDVPEYAFSELWQDKTEGITFGDVLDIINPLQHIPIVSTIYRMATEDDIGVGSRILGGALFGGPLGILITGLTAIIEEISGSTVDKQVASLWNSLGDEGDATSQIAAVENRGHTPAERPLIEDDLAVAATLSTPAAGEPEPVAVPVQIAATTKFASPQTADPTRLSPQPLARPPVTVSPMTAVHRVHSRPAHSLKEQSVTAERSAENLRIAKAIEQAQQAQAGLLLANLGAETNLGAESKDQPRNAGNLIALQQAQPFKAHPYLLPRGAPPQLISRAMEQALAKYQATLQQRSGGAPTLAP